MATDRIPASGTLLHLGAVDVGDVAQGAAAVEKLLDDSPTFEAVKDTYRQRFTEGAMIRRITEEYEQ